MQDSSGFYRHEDTLLYGPNAIHGPSLNLLRDAKDEYTYPVEGWYWFDSEDEARAFFGLPPKQEEEQGPWTETQSPSE